MFLRKSRFLIGVVLSLVLCLGIALIATSTSASDGRAWFLTEEETDAYEFPVYTGTESLGWLGTLAFLQVPEETLKAMSTDGLIETCLTYPIYSIGMITSNQSMHAGFQNTVENFNGFAELFQREDAGRKLLALYQGIDQSKAVRSSELPYFRTMYMEYLLAQDEILTKLSIEERSALQTACIRKVSERMQKYDDQFPTESGLLIIARISYMDDPVFTAYVKEHGHIMLLVNTGIMPQLNETELAEFKDAIDIQWEVN